MKKIYIHKKDSVPAVIQKILDCRETEIVLSIPAGSALEHRGGEFYLILRETKAAGKQISILTESERIIEYAAAAGIKVENLPAEKEKKSLTDIIPRRPFQMPAKMPVEEHKAAVSERSQPDLHSRSRINAFLSFKRRKSRPMDDAMVKTGGEKRFSFRHLKYPAVFLASLFLISLTALILIFLPRLQVHLVFKKIDWVFQDEVVAAVQTKDLTYEKVVIPAQLFRLDKNLVFEAPATGEKYVEHKAVGKIIIYNAYSSKPQPLVKNTRFVTPEGKIFRLIKNVTIPGAEVREGKIIPSSIEAEVIADQPGEAYNLGPVSRLRIPGFQGTAKYDGFYGELKEPTKGGFVGNVRVPTESDIVAAKEAAYSRVKDVLRFEILNRMPAGFKILEGADHFEVLREEVDTVADEAGKFKVIIYAEHKILAFRDEDLINSLRRRFFEDRETEDFILRNYTLAYRLNSADFENNILRLGVEFNSQWIRSFDEEKLKEKLAGQREARIKTEILSLPGIDRAKIEFFPFLVTTAPKNTDKIGITFE